MKEFIPRPMQRPMLDHVFSNDRWALWAGMGTGKTAVVLTLLEALYLGGETAPTLILGPLRVARKVWSDEVKKWDHLSGLQVVPIIGTREERALALRKDAPVYTTNYDNLIWLIEHYGDRWPFRTVIADEADYLKGHRVSYRYGKKADGSQGKEFIAGEGSKRAAALAKIAHTHIKRFGQLTGTPSPNGLADLWGQLWFLDRGRRLGRTYTDFSKRWFRPKEDNYGSEPLEHSGDQIHTAVKDICLSIDGKDWFDLKAPVVNNVYVDMDIRSRTLYKKMQKELFIEIGDRSAEAFNGAAKTQKLLQLANGAVYVDPLCEMDSSPNSKEWRLVHDEKIEALESIVHETAGAPLLVAYEFKSDLARLTRAFKQGRVLRTTQDEDDFKAGKIPMLFAHPKSAGHGIDGFQYACNNLVFFGHNWSLGQRMQITERIGPMRQLQAGFERPVYIHNIIARNTVDELVMDRHESKRSVQELLMEACKRFAV